MQTPNDDSMKVMTLTLESIDLYLNRLRARGHSDSTVRAYSSDLRLFLSAIPTTVSAESYEDQAQWFLTSQRQTWSPTTTRRRMASLKSYAKMMMNLEVLSDYRGPTPLAPEPHPLPEGMAGVHRLIAAAVTDDERLAVGLTGLAGCRIGEALQVAPCDIDFQAGRLLVHGKGDKLRSVPVSSRLRDHLQGPTLRASSYTSPLLRIGDRQARRTVTELGRRAGLERPISSHDLRATFATALYEKTKDIRLVQKILGHASVVTTQVYIGVSLAREAEGVEGL